jgi:hypothetical protein
MKERQEEMNEEEEERERGTLEVAKRRWRFHF